MGRGTAEEGEKGTRSGQVCTGPFRQSECLLSPSGHFLKGREEDKAKISPVLRIMINVMIILVFYLV